MLLIDNIIMYHNDQKNYIRDFHIISLNSATSHKNSFYMCIIFFNIFLFSIRDYL